jgi:tRNA (guanine26-N2/guanine27-N2)-dimethyltransferase
VDLDFGFPTEALKEGEVEFLAPRLKAFVKEAWEYAPSKAPVFYNPAMELNRDLAMLTVQTYQRLVNRELVACEPLTGCGVRGIRLAKEVAGVRKVVVNDISSDAATLASFNVSMNGLTDKVLVDNKDANLLLSSYAAPRKRFDYVDIDPFGSPALYIDSALRALRNGGLLALTATDMAPLCGIHAKACLRKYGGKPLRTEYCHELAVRLLISSLVMLAAKHDIGVNVVFSYSDLNYVRTYAIASYGAKSADNSVQSMGYILHCFSCFHRESQSGLTSLARKDCPECGSKLQIAGPLWVGPLWDKEFCAKLIAETRRRDLRSQVKILNMALVIASEIYAPITYYVIDKVCDKFSLPVPSLSKVIDRLAEAGFPAVATHFSSKAVRTNAPAAILKETLTGLAKVPATSMREAI